MFETGMWRLGGVDLAVKLETGNVAAGKTKHVVQVYLFGIHPIAFA